MLHLLSSSASPSDAAVLRAMFEARKAVFVDLLKWDVPVIDGRFEVDQFDDEHARYLILADPDGRHLGSARLLPTSRPHILDSLYPMLCETDPPRGPDTFEITRFCLDRRLTARDRRSVRDTLVMVLANFALDQRISAYSVIAEMGWYQQILAFGWRCRPLGLPLSLGGRMLAALRIEIDQTTPERLSSGGILPDKALLDVPYRAAA